MDDWTYPYPNLDVDAPAPDPMLLDEVREAVEDRFRTTEAQGAADRVAEFEQPEAQQAVDGLPFDADVPLPFATPPGAALAF